MALFFIVFPKSTPPFLELDGYDTKELFGTDGE